VDPTTSAVVGYEVLEVSRHKPRFSFPELFSPALSNLAPRSSFPRSRRFFLPADAGLVQHEGVFHGDLAIALEAAGLAAVAGLHVDMQEHRILVGLQGAQLAIHLAGS